MFFIFLDFSSKAYYTAYKLAIYFKGEHMFISQNNLSAQEDIILNIDKPIKQPWWDKKGFIAAAIFSAVWLAFIWDYLFSSGWWGTRHELSPAEFIGGLCGLFIPIVIAVLISSYFDRANQLSYEAQSLRSYLGELVYPTNSGATYTRSITNALREQVQEFKKVYTNTARQSRELGAHLQQWSEELSQHVQQLNANTTASIQELSDTIERLNAHSIKAGKQVSQSAVLFNEKLNLLQKLTNESSVSFNPILTELETVATALKKIETSLKESDLTAKNILAGTQNSTHKIEENLNNIKDIISSYELTSSKKEELLESRLKQAKAVLNIQNEALEKSDKFLKEHEDIILKAQTSIRSHNTALTQAETHVKNHQETLDKTLSSSIQKIKEIDASLIENCEKTTVAIDTAIEKLKTAHNNFKETIQTDDLFKNQENDLNKTQVKKPVDFLQNASAILDKLQTFSIDMAHIFTPKSESTLWKKYYDGDKTVFMRHITRMISETQHKQIKELYMENTDFNQAINRYMSEFEDMTQAVQKEDENKLLMSILIGSDIGRLYMVLADVLKRQDS